MVPGTLGDTEMQMFNVDSSGNLALALLTSDTTYVSTPFTNIALYWSSTSPSWDWGKKMIGVSNEVLIDLKIRKTDSGRMALLYKSSLLIVLDTANGNLVRTHT
jgi:hypothetical protein